MPGGLVPSGKPGVGKGTPPPAVRSIRYFRDDGSSGLHDTDHGGVVGTPAVWKAGGAGASRVSGDVANHRV